MAHPCEGLDVHRILVLRPTFAVDGIGPALEEEHERVIARLEE